MDKNEKLLNEIEAEFRKRGLTTTNVQLVKKINNGYEVKSNSMTDENINKLNSKIKEIEKKYK